MTGSMHHAPTGYKSQIDPREKQCVLLSVGQEFSGRFLFLGNRVGPDELEVIRFVVGADGGKE